MANHLGGIPLPDREAAPTTRVFQAGGFCFRVRCSSGSLVRTIEELFRDLIEPQRQQGSMRDISLSRQSDGRLLIEGTTWSDPQPVDPDFALDLLVGLVNRLALDAEPEALHLHAGCVALGDRAAVIAAPSGTGKSTLTTALVTRGWTYLSDETVRVDDGGLQVSGFPKPLTIKSTGQHLWPQLRAHRLTIDHSDRSSWQVPASALGAACATRAGARLIVLLHRGDDASEARAEPVHPADATVHLLTHALDGRRYGAPALGRLADLVRRSAPFRVYAGTPTTTSMIVEELMEQAADGPLVEMEVLGVSGALGRATVATDVSTLALADRVVIYRTSTGTAASFDVHGSRTWRRLLEMNDDDDLATMVAEPGTGPFLLQLEELGFACWDSPLLRRGQETE